MRLLRIGLVLAAGCGWPALAQTNAPEIRRMSLEDCIGEAVQHNFDVQIRRYDPELARFTLWADYGSYDPTLSLGGAHGYRKSAGGIDAQGRPFGATDTEFNSFDASVSSRLPWGTTLSLSGDVNDTYGTSLNVPFENVTGFMGFNPALRQPLLRNFWIDDVRLQIEVSKKQVTISEQDLRSQIISSITDVETAYYNLIFAQENVKVQQKALELAERLLAENKKRVEVGALAPLDERQAESQAAQSRADLINALGVEDSQQRVLKNLISDNYSEWHKITIAPTERLIALPQRFELQESWRVGLQTRPELVQQKLRLEQQGYRIRFQHNQLFPQLDFVGSAGYGASARSFDATLDQLGGRDYPTYTIGGQFSMPLSRAKERNNYRSAKATREQMELTLRQLQQVALIDIENNIATANTDFQQVTARREATRFASEALEAEQKKLESGKSTSFIVLQLQKNLTQARSDEIRALADYNIALANFAKSEGTTLERRKVKLEVKP